MIRYLAIDPSIKACGLAWRSPHRACKNIIDTKVFSVASDSWIVAIRDEVEPHYKITHAVIEQANGFGPNVKAAFALAEVRGRIIEACLLSGLKIIRVNVTTWQSAMLGKRVTKGDTKARSIASAKSLGVDTNDHNIADAVNILVYSELNKLGEPE